MMRSGSDLLHLLGDEPPTASTVDVRGAIAAGRRRKTVRRTGYAATGAAVAVTAVLAGGALLPRTPEPIIRPAVAPTVCTVRELAVPDGVPVVMVLGSDRTGRFLAGHAEPAGDPVLWQGGVPATPAFPGTGRARLTAVNSQGTAVGWGFARNDDKAPLPYVYQRAAFTRLPGVTSGRALAINDAGAIAGEAEGSAVWWPSVTGDAVHLPVPDGTKRSYAFGIDADGTIIGSADQRTFAWRPDGTRLELPALTIGGMAAPVTTPARITDGWVVGLAATGTPSAPGASATFRWQVATGEVQLTTDPPRSAAPGAPQIGGFGPDLVADSVTGDGWLVGSLDGDPVLITGAGTLPLPLPAGTMPMAGTMFTVSADGRTVTGHVVGTGGGIRPVVWSCG